MEGVPEEATRQKALVDAEQAVIEGRIVDARHALEAALTQRLNDSTASLDATVARLAQELLDAENTAIAGVDGFRQAEEAATSDLRTALLEDIKVAVWRLGYTQGYEYGANDGVDIEIQREIAAMRDQFEAAVAQSLQDMWDRVQTETDAGDARTTAAYEELEGEFVRLTDEMEDAIAAALESWANTLATERAALRAETQRATADFHAFIDGRLADWGAQHALELQNAQWQEDSYYRYHLIVLLQKKQEAIDAAVAEAKAGFAAWMAQELADGVAFRAGQNDIFSTFVSTTRASLAAAIQVDWDQMATIVEERTASLDARLADQKQQHADAMQACRELMALRLKEIYSYNSYDLGAIEAKGDNIAAPYSHEQHVNFIQKFAYYQRDSLRGFDGRNKDFVTGNAVKVAALTEESLDEVEAMELVIGDRNDDHQKAVGRAADAMLEAYDELQVEELAALRDNRAATEASADAAAEQAKLGVIYAMHVLQYAGGKDRGNFGFGLGASSFYGKGNGLTGVDELDLYREGNYHGYAQVKDITSDDVHHADLVASLEGAKQDFDDAMQACIDDFTAHAEAEHQQAADTRDQLINDLYDMAVAAHEDLLALGQSSEDTLKADNDARRSAFYDHTQEKLDAFTADIATQEGKVVAWFGDRLEWVAKLFDSGYKERLVAELEQKRDEALASLAGRQETAETIMATSRAQLDSNLSDLEDRLWDFHSGESDDFADFAEDTLYYFEKDTGVVYDRFCGEVEDEIEAKQAYVDATTQNWAYWLKFIYGYQGYQTSLYQHYDDTVDYGAGFADNNNELYPGNSSHGYGYGGLNGEDYIYSNEHTGLAYGTEIGPDPAYFSNSLFDHGHYSDMMDTYAGFGHYSGLATHYPGL
jgi:hypothetical protein